MIQPLRRRAEIISWSYFAGTQVVWIALAMYDRALNLLLGGAVLFATTLVFLAVFSAQRRFPPLGSSLPLSEGSLRWIAVTGGLALWCLLALYDRSLTAFLLMAVAFSTVYSLQAVALPLRKKQP